MRETDMTEKNNNNNIRSCIIKKSAIESWALSSERKSHESDFLFLVASKGLEKNRDGEKQTSVIRNDISEWTRNSNK